LSSCFVAGCLSLQKKIVVASAEKQKHIGHT